MKEEAFAEKSPLTMIFAAISGLAVRRSAKSVRGRTCVLVFME